MSRLQTEKKSPKKSPVVGRVVCSLPPGHSLGLGSKSLVDQIALLNKGLPYGKIEQFERKSGLPMDRIANVMVLSSGVKASRRRAGRFNAIESERLFRLSRIFEQAVQLFDGDRAAAVTWLDSPCRALGGEVPLDFAKSELGAHEVENVIGRLEHGVFQ